MGRRLGVYSGKRAHVFNSCWQDGGFLGEQVTGIEVPGVAWESAGILTPAFS